MVASRSASTSCTSRSFCLARGTKVESGNMLIMLRYSDSARSALLGRGQAFHLLVVDVGHLHLRLGRFRRVGKKVMKSLYSASAG